MSNVGLNLEEFYSLEELQGNSTGGASQLGQVFKTHDGKEYVYVQLGTGGVTGDGYVCIISAAFAAVMIDASNATVGMRIGVAEGAGAASEYGWLQIYGACGIRTAASMAAAVWPHGTATAGQLDDATQTIGAPAIFGLRIGTATGGQAAVNTTGFLTYPSGALIPEEV